MWLLTIGFYIFPVFAPLQVAREAIRPGANEAHKETKRAHKIKIETLHPT